MQKYKYLVISFVILGISFFIKSIDKTSIISAIPYNDDGYIEGTEYGNNTTYNLSDYKLAEVIATVAGEDSYSYEGSLAVVSTMCNRADQYGTDPYTEAIRPNQYVARENKNSTSGYMRVMDTYNSGGIESVKNNFSTTYSAVINALENGNRNTTAMGFRSYNSSNIETVQIGKNGNYYRNFTGTVGVNSSENSSYNLINNSPNIVLSHYGTPYEGDFRQGWIYDRFDFKEVFNLNTPDYKIEENIDDNIDGIFDRAKTSYYSAFYGSNFGLSGFYGSLDAGPYDLWRQYDSKWKSIHLGNSSYTLGSAGCAVTSVAIQMARAGATASFEINPGSLTSYLNSNGGFTDGGAIYWASVSKASPSFNYVGTGPSGYGNMPVNNRISTISDYLSQDKYVVAHVGGSIHGDTSNHWVAVTAVDNGNVIMIDPAGRGTSINETYGSQYIDEIRIYEMN